jgi:hypothetical protein
LWKLFAKNACAVGFVATLSILIILIVSMIGMFVDILLMLWVIIALSLYHSPSLFKNVSNFPFSFKTDKMGE